jgi:ferritin-like metal-binding protein YciE
MDETQMNLLSEQLRSTINLLKVEINKLRQEVEHQGEFTSHRLEQLEKCVADHENRIRSATDGVTQFKVWSGLASGGSSVMSIVALIKVFFS